MAASAIIILQKAGRIAELLEERVGVKGPETGPRLGPRLRRASRMLPSEARRAARRVAVAERKAQTGGIVDIDAHRFDDDYRLCLRHIQEIRPGSHGPGLLRGLLQGGLTAVLSLLMLYAGLAYAGLI
ncbi:hypothetical protein C0V75_11910 [Tabrizicola sp. TH137]|uniref:hypothetical protein n=1 Tax=Tabrizicola sp. TH137 TaxID=2067452 RepID=UPI000C7AAFEE|nr:hypothetical protein [Tabrizicola sp. TH137]PLL12623.1 hypothetical protein C0V75_11910 [Tabrizicola sp. TH137]